MSVIDFRSDTLTVPSDEMRQHMAHAEVGDDVFVEDPTINHLEQRVATLLGKQKGLFVPSGTMSNLIAMMLHGQGLCSEIIVGDVSHTSAYEVGGASVVGRVMLRQLPTNADGTIDLALIRSAIQSVNVHNTTTKCIVLENTHNAKGGKVLPASYLKEVRAICDAHDMRMHCDGARLWNAAVALGVPPAEVLECFDTASVCLSKGLGAPVGSVLVGPEAFINDARRVRKMLGGGMRQAGILAAAGLYALDHMYERLKDDHAMAKRLASALVEMGFVVIAPDSNIVIWEVDASKRKDFVARCGEKALKLVAMGPTVNVRAIPHYGNSMEDVEKAIGIIAEVKAALQL